MKNFVQKGEVITYTNGSGATIASGAVVIVGSFVGIAVADILPAGSGAVNITGVYQLAKTTSLVITQGDELFWNAGTAKVTKTATDTPIGTAFDSELSAATTVLVKLAGGGNGIPIAGTVAALTGTLTGTANSALVDVAATAAATAGGATPTAAQVDTGIAAAVASIVTGVNEQNKEFQTTVNAILAALKAAGLMA